MSGSGHPLPRSDEARHDEIPEHLDSEKGLGDDGKEKVQPRGDAVTPDGEPYPAPGSGTEECEFAADQARHQDRGQTIADEETGPS